MATFDMPTTRSRQSIAGSGPSCCRGLAQKLLPDSLFIVGVTMEKHIGHLVLFAALEDRLEAAFLVQFLFFAPMPALVASRTTST